MKRNTVLVLILAMVMTFGTALVISANVPAPPVNQRIGIPDSIFNNLIAGQPGMITSTGECVPTPPGPGDVRSGPPVCTPNLQTCRGCHAFPSVSGVEDTTTPVFNDPSLPGDSVIPNRHHLLTQPPASMFCTDCHGFSSNPDGSITIVVTRDCLQCHASSDEGTVHHLTANAQSANCKACHGSLVNNMGDGHYIPSYAPSYVTPRPGANSGQGGTGATNPINGRKQGACDYCHGITSADNPVPGYSIETASQFKIYQSDVTHHSTGFGADGTKCTWCHNFSAPAPIRTCENCHGPTSLHNIQTSSATPPAPIDPGNESPGYGHIGSNADCNGCHGFTAAAGIDFGPATPFVAGISRGTVKAGQATQLTITGTGFTSVSGGVVVTDFVTLNGNSGSITLQPTSITSSSLVVTVPSTLALGNYDLRVANASKVSNLKILSVVPSVSISSVDVSGNQITITGSGFGTSPLGVTVNNSNCGITSWSDTQIVVSCQTVNGGDVVKVNALFGSASATIDSPNPPPACTSFTYSAWSTCLNGTQTRKVLSSAPAGCIGGTPLLTQTCISNKLPVANAGPDKTGMVNGLVKLDGSGSSDPDGYLTRYAWNFGDGTTAYGRIVYHKFVKVGTYKVTLIVTDNKGAKASDTAIVTIK